MASMTITFENPNTGAIKEAPIGFSWTTFFFGFFPALLRGHISMAIVMFVLAFLTFGLSGIVFAFIYNKMYVKHLMGEGYKASASDTIVKTASSRLGIQLPAMPSA